MTTEPRADQPKALRLSRTIDAPVELVFEAWSTAEHVGQWFSPERYSSPEATVEMRVGGLFEVCMRAPDGSKTWTRGRFAEIDPNRRLVLDLHAETADGRRLFGAYTEVDFIAEGQRTRLDIVQTYDAADPSLVAHMIKGAPMGWSQTLDKLEAEVARMRDGRR
ncbi:MAG TPA: SRPBCC domain-containing protein [Lichenihabitans sp.]|nr:SRPBCC domain-containing protein [Lichenihabitans sp.]